MRAYESRLGSRISPNPDISLGREVTNAYLNFLPRHQDGSPVRWRSSARIPAVGVTTQKVHTYASEVKVLFSNEWGNVESVQFDHAHRAVHDLLVDASFGAGTNDTTASHTTRTVKTFDGLESREGCCTINTSGGLLCYSRSGLGL